MHHSIFKQKLVDCFIALDPCKFQQVAFQTFGEATSWTKNINASKKGLRLRRSELKEFLHKWKFF